MKKNILLIIAVASITIVSCRKERTCECTTTNTDVRTGNNPGTTVSTSSTKLTKAKQKKNEFKYASDCFSTKGSYISQNGGNGSSAFTIERSYVTNCDLK
jgi:hypothetical protein